MAVLLTFFLAHDSCAVFVDSAFHHLISRFKMDFYLVGLENFCLKFPPFLNTNNICAQRLALPAADCGGRIIYKYTTLRVSFKDYISWMICCRLSVTKNVPEARRCFLCPHAGW